MWMEVLQHQAHLAELRLQVQQQQQMEALQHQAYLAEVQCQRQMEVLQHQAHLDELQRQQEVQRQINHDQEVLRHENHIAQQQQMAQQAQLEQIQVAIHNHQALMDIPLGCRPYQEPAHRHSLGPMDVECPNCHAAHFMSERLTKSSNIHPKFSICCLRGQIQLPPLSEHPHLLHKLFTSSAPHAQKFRDGIHQYNSAFASPLWLLMWTTLS